MSQKGGESWRPGTSGICIQWTGVLDWSAGMEYWNGVTGMDSLEWRILDRVSSSNFIMEGSSQITWP